VLMLNAGTYSVVKCQVLTYIYDNFRSYVVSSIAYYETTFSSFELTCSHIEKQEIVILKELIKSAFLLLAKFKGRPSNRKL
jgi:hypothetical protein